MRILVVEDDPITAKTIELVLTHAGLSPHVVGSGEDAILFAEQDEYELITLDINLPDMSGIDVLKQLRRRGIKIPIMVLTGENTTETKLVAFGHGADDYLIKPFHRDELVARVHAIVRRAQGHSQSKLQIGDVSLNLDTREATAAGKIIPLTRREFKMLELLFLYRGRTVTVDMFLNHLYAGMDEPQPEIIKVYVCQLRNRLGEHGAMIETIYGTGYIVRGPHESRAA